MQWRSGVFIQAINTIQAVNSVAAIFLQSSTANHFTDKREGTIDDGKQGEERWYVSNPEREHRKTSVPLTATHRCQQTLSSFTN
jgi:hypothetical protein